MDLAAVADTRLTELHPLTDEALADALRRIVPDTTGQRVPVAAFNSSI